MIGWLGRREYAEVIRTTRCSIKVSKIKNVMQDVVFQKNSVIFEVSMR